MSDEHSLTFAVQMEIDRYAEQQIAKANAQLNRQQTAEDLFVFLTDDTKLATPGFVLRRHLQSQGWLMPREKCSDLNENGNEPWPDEAVKRVAKELNSISYRCHGLEISTAHWKQYLEDDMMPGRDIIFQLAIVTDMGRETTIRLLMACGEAPYNMRSPVELICWFCQRVPGTYTWRGIEELLKKYQKCSAEAEKDAGGNSQQKEPVKDATCLLRWNVDEILASSKTAPETEQALIELMVENRAELKGFSQTARNKYLRLLDYLNTLYSRKGPVRPYALINAMFKRQNWNFKNVHQTKSGERYVFRGEEGDSDGASREVVYKFDMATGKIALFCKWYGKRINAIQNSTDQSGKEIDEWEDVHRWDVLLLGYFLITGYTGAKEETRADLWTLTEQDDPMDRRMALLRQDLDALRRDTDLMEKKVLCSRVLNELLSEFGFHPLYVLASFDRFIFLSLLTDDPAWTTRYLLGEDLEA